MEVNRESPASKRDTGYDMNKKEEEREAIWDEQKVSKERESYTQDGKKVSKKKL